MARVLKIDKMLRGTVIHSLKVCRSCHKTVALSLERDTVTNTRGLATAICCSHLTEDPLKTLQHINKQRNRTVHDRHSFPGKSPPKKRMNGFAGDVYLRCRESATKMLLQHNLGPRGQRVLEL